MSDSSGETDALVRRIHDAGCSLVLAVTGGGSQAIAGLLSVPGASRCVIEALVPYHAAALARFLGAQPDQYCSAATARSMAMAAYRRAGELAPERGPLLGIACTASLASDRPKRGAHRLHAAWQSASTSSIVSIELAAGRTRAQEEHLVATVVLNLIAEAVGLADRLPIDLMPEEGSERANKQAPQSWQDLLAGRVEQVCSALPQGESAGSPVIFPGAFNPLHAGHRQMAAVAARLLGRAPIYEISILNVDKPPLDFLEIERRAGQFAVGEPYCLTRAATFVEKARLFPGATFVAGADTIERLVDPKYYGGTPAGTAAAIEALAVAGCRFLVFGRVADGNFRGLDHLNLPAQFKAICRSVPEAEFRSDVSSTALRQASSQ